MLTVKTFTCNMFQENSYVLGEAGGEAAIIDNGALTKAELLAIDTYISDQSLTPVLLLNTHTHIDHSFGNAHMLERYGLKARFHENDADLYAHLSAQARFFLGEEVTMPVLEPGEFLTDGQQLTFGNHSLTVIHTPGHTSGGVCFYAEDEDMLWSGDTFFRYSIGRSDFPGGDGNQLLQSIRSRLCVLPPHTIVYPGHGPTTKIGDELSGNPFLFSV